MIEAIGLVGIEPAQLGSGWLTAPKLTGALVSCGPGALSLHPTRCPCVGKVWFVNLELWGALELTGNGEQRARRGVSEAVLQFPIGM